MKSLRILALSAAVLSAGSVYAADQMIVTDEGVGTFSFFKPASVRVEAGTTGYGGAISYGITPKVGVSIGYNEGELGYNGDIGNKDVDWNTDFDMKNGYITGTYRPFSGNFGIDFGTYYQDNEIRATADPKAGGVYRVNNSNFTTPLGLTNVKGTVTFRNEVAPFLGVSYSPSITERFGLFGQLGVVWQGKPEANLTTNNPALLSDDKTQTLGQALAAEKADIEGDSQYEFLPVAKLGLQVRF
ncbi:MAG: hypothetical protein RLY58_918 [Pseudomonadota bacterium]|jgi:hypothetical protein